MSDLKEMFSRGYCRNTNQTANILEIRPTGHFENSKPNNVIKKYITLLGFALNYITDSEM